MALILNLGLAATASNPASPLFSYTVADKHGSQTRTAKYEATSDAKALSGLCDTVNQTAGYLRVTSPGSTNKNYFSWFFESRS